MTGVAMIEVKACSDWVPFVLQQVLPEAMPFHHVPSKDWPEEREALIVTAPTEDEDMVPVVYFHHCDGTTMFTTALVSHLAFDLALKDEEISGGPNDYVFHRFPDMETGKRMLAEVRRAREGK